MVLQVLSFQSWIMRLSYKTKPISLFIILVKIISEGYVTVPYLGDTKLSVRFENIKINTDNQLIEGVVRTGYDAEWSNVVEAPVILGIEQAIAELKNIIEQVAQAEKEIAQNKISKAEFDKKNRFGAEKMEWAKAEVIFKEMILEIKYSE